MKPTPDAHNPSLNNDHDLEVAIAEYLIAEDEGHPLDVEDWLRRHDSLRDRLSAFLQDQRRTTDALAGHTPNATLDSRVPSPVNAGYTSGIGSTASPGCNSDDSGLVDTIEFRSEGGQYVPLPAKAPSRLPFEPVAGIGIYRFERLLGTGGMGRVYEAIDDQGHRFAIKLIASANTPPQETVERFKHEGLIASSINHPRCVFVHAADTADGQPFIAMELMPGTTLKDWVQAHGPLHLTDALEKILDVIDGLHAAHQSKLIHRDVKPSNCYIDAHGRVKVGDFGLAKSMEFDAGLTRTGNIVGTPLFASPEQLRGESLDARTDVYSTCATLYYLLTGKAPFEHPNPTTLIARALTQDAPPIREVRSDIPVELERVLAAGLSRNRDARPASMEALRELLTHFLPGPRRLAGVGVRFAALCIDMTMLSIVMIFAALLRPDWFTDQQMETPRLRIESHVFTSALQALTFLACEFRFRTTLGKRILGLRVQLSDSEGVWSLGRCMIRVAVWWMASGVVTDCLLVWYGRPLLMTFQDPLQWLGYAFGYALLCAPLLWRRDGRMLHDLASGTHVEHFFGTRAGTKLLEWPNVRDGATVDPPPMEQVEKQRLGAERVFGRFRDCQLLMSVEGGRWFVGQDRALSRLVWILERPEGATEVSEERRTMARSSRLRWIASGVQEQRRWDAFLAVESIPIEELASRGLALEWSTIRRGLLDVAQEIKLAREIKPAQKNGMQSSDGWTVELTSELSNVRMSRDGNLVWLDGLSLANVEERRGGEASSGDATQTASSVRATDSRLGDSWNEQTSLEFMWRVANALLEPTPKDARATREERVIPYSAWQNVNRLKRDHPQAWPSVAAFAEALEKGDENADRSRFRNRAIQVITQVVLSFAPFGAMLAVLGLGHLIRLDRIQDEWLRLHSFKRIATSDAAKPTIAAIAAASKDAVLPNIDWSSETWRGKLQQAIDRLETNQELERTKCSSIDNAVLQSAGTLFLDSQTVETMQATNQLQTGGAYVWELPNEIPAKCAPYAIADQEGNVAVTAKMREAFGISGAIRADRLAESLLRVEQGRTDVPLHKKGRLVLMSLGGWILLSLWGMVFRGGIGRWVAGLVIVDEEGRLASRWRLLWRSMLLWGPLGMCLSATICLEFFGWTDAWMSFGLRTTCVVLPFVYLALGLLSGRRGVHDRWSGTRVVPR